VLAVVAHEEVMARLDLRPGSRRLVVATAGLEVRLFEPVAVDVDVAVALAHDLPRQADQALHEGAAGAAAELRLRRGVEDDDLAAPRVAEPVDKAVCEHPVTEPRLATVGRPRAMERRFH
jgi:hypothetical protein